MVPGYCRKALDADGQSRLDNVGPIVGAWISTGKRDRRDLTT